MNYIYQYAIISLKVLYKCEGVRKIKMRKEDNPQVKEYKNDDLIVYWERPKCIHAAECTHGLPDVFRPRSRPWINLDNADSEEIIKVIDACPSGALKYDLTENSKIDKELARGKGSVHYEKPCEASIQIKVMDDGPFIVNGQIELVNQNDELIETCNNPVLCRCGRSQKKPFCDGSHSKAE